MPPRIHRLGLRGRLLQATDLPQRGDDPSLEREALIEQLHHPVLDGSSGRCLRLPGEERLPLLLKLQGGLLVRLGDHRGFDPGEEFPLPFLLRVLLQDLQLCARLAQGELGLPMLEPRFVQLRGADVPMSEELFEGLQRIRRADQLGFRRLDVPQLGLLLLDREPVGVLAIGELGDLACGAGLLELRPRPLRGEALGVEERCQRGGCRGSRTQGPDPRLQLLEALPLFSQDRLAYLPGNALGRTLRKHQPREEDRQNGRDHGLRPPLFACDGQEQ